MGFWASFSPPMLEVKSRVGVGIPRAGVHSFDTRQLGQIKLIDISDLHVFKI